MNRPHFSCFEPLESRELLATDVLANISATERTLSARPRNLVDSGFALYFDAIVDDLSERAVFEVRGDEVRRVLEGSGKIDSSAVLSKHFLFVSGGAVYSTSPHEGRPTRLLTSAKPNHDIELIALSADKALIVERADRTYHIQVTDGGEVLETLELPFANTAPTLLAVAQRRAWFLDSGVIWSTDGVNRTIEGRGPTFLSEVGPFSHSLQDRVVLFEGGRFGAEYLENLDDEFGIWRLDTERSPFSPQLNTGIGFGPMRLIQLARVSDITGTSDMVIQEGNAYFAADSDEWGRELWSLPTRGQSTPKVVFDAIPGERSSRPEYLTAYRDRIVFAGSNNLYSFDPRRDDGQLLYRFDASPMSLSPHSLTEWNGQIYFVADGGQGEEIWATDGTAAGTQLVVDIMPGRASSRPTHLEVSQGHLYFTATTPETGEELWRLNAEGQAEIVRDLRTTHARSNPFISELTEYQGHVYFRFNDGQHGVELWRTDGTVEGTFMVKDVFPGDRGGSPRELNVFNDLLYFVANDGEHGYELWRTDGSLEGTAMVADLRPGVEGSVPTGFTVTEDQTLWFGGHDGTPGEEIWRITSSMAESAPELAYDLASPRNEDFGNLSAVVKTADEILFWAGAGVGPRHLFRITESEGEKALSTLTRAYFFTPIGAGNQVFYYDWRPGFFAIDLEAGRRRFLGEGRFSEENSLPEEAFVPFAGGVYYLDRVLKSATDGNVEIVWDDVVRLAANETHLFGWNPDLRRSSQVFVLRADGTHYPLLPEPLQIQMAVVGPQGVAFASLEPQKNLLSIWKSNGEMGNVTPLGQLPGHIGIQEMTLVGNQVLVLASDNGKQTLLAFSHEFKGDLNANGRLDGADVDVLVSQLRAGEPSAEFDLNQDRIVDSADLDFLITIIAKSRRGDLDLDGDVDFIDFLTLADNFETGTLYSEGDISGDGKVDFQDFLLFEDSFRS